MDRVTEIRFPSSCLFDIFGVGEHRFHAGLLQDVVNRDPVFSGGLQTYIIDAIPCKPFSHAADVTVGRRELPDIKDCRQSCSVCYAGAGHQDGLVDIDRSADRTFDIIDRGSDDFCAIIKDGGPELGACVSSLLTQPVH